MKRICKPAVLGIISCCIMGGVLSCGQKDGMSASTRDLTKQYQSDNTEFVSVEPGQEFRTSYTDFSLRLLDESRKLSGEQAETGTLVSPLSVMLALEMTRSGAEGKTAAQMDETLYPGISPKQGREGILAFSRSLSERQAGEVYLADSIWFRDGFSPEEEFLETNAREFDAEIYEAPFDESTLKDINGWVEQKTEGMVREILDKIPENGIMYLVNAVAFDGQWETVYDSSQVQEGSFQCGDGSIANVPFLFSNESFYLEDDYAEGFIKPYQNGYSLAVLMPMNGMSLEEYISQLEGEAFLNTLEQAVYCEVYAGLPKFEADTSLELSEVLKIMGMPLAFDEEQADFSGIGTSKYGNVFINRVLHKTHIEVDEQGTKAGAATVVEMAEETAISLEQKTVILNRPFLYVIVDDTTNLPVFIGTVENL